MLDQLLVNNRVLGPRLGLGYTRKRKETPDFSNETTETPAGLTSGGMTNGLRGAAKSRSIRACRGRGTCSRKQKSKRGGNIRRYRSHWPARWRGHAMSSSKACQSSSKSSRREATPPSLMPADCCSSAASASAAATMASMSSSSSSCAVAAEAAATA